MRKLVLVVVGSLVTFGCGVESDRETSARQSSAILSGATDDMPRGVVAVLATEMCSGFILTPDLVVTAHHCVSDIANTGCFNGDGGPSSSAGPPYAPGAFGVVLGTDAQGTALPVAEVTVFPSGTADCGNDLAILRLVSPVDPSLALVPRLEGPPVVKEPVTAVGYGASEGGPDTTSGTRRVRSDLSVTHVGAISGRTTDGEWNISEGPCAGDSGSPALASDGRVIGVMSRGSKTTCMDMIYERVDVHADWLRDAGTASYARLSMPLPAWIAGDAAMDAGSDSASPSPAAPPAASGCSQSRVARVAGNGGFIAGFVVLGALRRRRRASC